ncbi:MAG: hypothetical protein HY513_02995 [Candidatus Aenigmarchaeota archaeon]|nr:hypothetical protein [Candidatus Aenigmarchaeota archaeon]
MPIYNNKSTKEVIIEILSKEWPLSARKIYYTITKSHNLSISYQATHKALKELLQQNTIIKNQNGYQLHADWINKMNEFGQRVKKDYENNSGETKTVQKLVFKTPIDFIKFHFGFLEKLIETEGKVDFVFFCRHVISSPPLAVSGDDYKKLKKIMSKCNWTIVSNSSTPFDNWAANYWKKLGVKVKLGFETPTNGMMVINNDYVFDIRMSKKSRDEWDHLVNSKAKDFDINSMTEVLLSEKSKMIVFITKDKELADTLREY